MQLSFVEGRNRMKLCNKISKGVAKGAEVICMLTIAALVLVIVVELLRRNFLGQSFGGNVQLCGILFLWMAFIGLIPPVPGQRPDAPGLPCRRTRARCTRCCTRTAVSLLLGVVMVVAFAAQYPYVSTRTYSTFPIPVPYTVQYFPMCLAGAYMALESLGGRMAQRVENGRAAGRRYKGGTRIW